LTSHDYVIQRKDGSIVKHYVFTRQSNKLYSDVTVEILTFETEKKAQEVAQVLKGECEVVKSEYSDWGIAA
jgi:hypothetical protein